MCKAKAQSSGRTSAPPAPGLTPLAHFALYAPFESTIFSLKECLPTVYRVYTLPSSPKPKNPKNLGFSTLLSSMLTSSSARRAVAASAAALRRAAILRSQRSACFTLWGMGGLKFNSIPATTTTKPSHGRRGEWHFSRMPTHQMLCLETQCGAARCCVRTLGRHINQARLTSGCVWATDLTTLC